jgi:hypothetical protein
MIEKITWVKANLGDSTVSRLVAALTKKNAQIENGGCGCGCGDGTAPPTTATRKSAARS